MSKKIIIDDIKEGMVLAETINNSSGQTILKAGAELKSKHKMLLKIWNINEIIIRNDDDSEEIVDEENLKEVAKSKFMKRLKWKPTNEFEQEIIEIGIQELYLKISSNSK